jgi:C1A family cysteine protease
MPSIQKLSTSLETANARWAATDTPLFQLTDAEKARRLGVIIDPAALATAMAPRAKAVAPQFEQAIDWRNRNGNHVTPVKDQGACGSCVSFCTVATIESMASIELGQSLNLSEADLHFCSSHGATCDGWWPDRAYDELKSRGVVHEAQFPYASAFSGANPTCNTRTNREAYAVRITESTTLQSAVERKNWLTQVGPCSAVMRVFDDFFAYRSGVYHHVSGKETGLHCVEIIGYSEAEQCWIVKNSWGVAWGDQGFFKIAYGEAGIDTDFPFWTARGVKLPEPSPNVRYDGIWVPGNDNRPSVRGWTLEDFQKKNGECYSQGYRLMHQQRYDIGGMRIRYDGIWAPGNDGRPIVWGWTLEDFQKKNGECYGNGYRLMHQQCYAIGGGQVRYDGIWVPGNDGRPIVWGWTLEDFQKHNGECYSNGYRLMHQQQYDIGGGQIRYDGIWAPGDDGRPIVWGWTSQDFQKKNGECYNGGYRLMSQQRYRLR